MRLIRMQFAVFTPSTTNKALSDRSRVTYYEENNHSSSSSDLFPDKYILHAAAPLPVAAHVNVFGLITHSSLLSSSTLSPSFVLIRVL